MMKMKLPVTVSYGGHHPHRLEKFAFPQCYCSNHRNGGRGIQRFTNSKSQFVQAALNLPAFLNKDINMMNVHSSISTIPIADDGNKKFPYKSQRNMNTTNGWFLLVASNNSSDRHRVQFEDCNSSVRPIDDADGIRATTSDDHPVEREKKNKKLFSSVVTWSAMTLILAVVNRVCHKLALVPMKEYPLFLAQINSIVYVAIFFPVLYIRHRSGIITDEMLSIPKGPLMLMGFLESVAIVSGMYAGAMLPGPVIPLLYQTFLVWQLIFSSVLLGKRYSLNQTAGCFLVAAGVVVAVTSGSNNGQMLSGLGIVWPTLMVASSAFQAAASIVKEFVFIDAANRLKGKMLDVFVVNGFNSGFQAFFILLFLPILSNLKGISLSELPLYFKSGAACFLNIGANTMGCDGAPILPLLFIISSIVFNVSILNLLKHSNAIVASLAVRASVPIAIYVLSLSLPYLPKGASLSPFFHLGSMILVVGLILYNIHRPNRQGNGGEVQNSESNSLNGRGL